MNQLNVGILIFDGVEVLDFAGPYEVFSRTRTEPGVESRRSDASAPFNVFTVAQRPAPVTVTGGLRVLPDYDFGSAPPIDLMVIPGGFGTRALLENVGVLHWIAHTSAEARRTTSVCTGSLLLARAPPRPHAVGTHGHRSPPRDRRPPSQKARGRRRGARPEPRARAPTPASGRGCAASGDASELGPSRRWVSSSPQAARDFWRISILT